MEYKVIGDSDLRVSRICIGTAQIGEKYTDCNIEELKQMFKCALDRGVNFIDTARNYGDSEQTLGRLLKNKRNKFIIATKFSGREFDYETVKEQLCVSLKNLQTDYIDLYQIHWPKMKILGAKQDMQQRDYDDISETMAKIKKEGMIRYAGVSNFRIKHLKVFKTETLDSIISNQIPYSLLWRIYDVDGTAQFCKKHNINFLAYMPLAGGMLTGKISKEDAGAMKNSVLFNEPVFTPALQITDEIKGIAEGLGCTPAQVAIRWLMEKEIISAAVVGVRKTEHLKQNIDAMRVILTDEKIRKLDKLSLDFQKKHLSSGLEMSVPWTASEELRKIGIK